MGFTKSFWEPWSILRIPWANSTTKQQDVWSSCRCSMLRQVRVETAGWPLVFLSNFGTVVGFFHTKNDDCKGMHISHTHNKYTDLVFWGYLFIYIYIYILRIIIIYICIYIYYIYSSPYAFQTVGARINWFVVLAMTVGYFSYFLWTPYSRRCLRCYPCKYKTCGEPISTIALDDLTFTGTQVHYKDNVCTTAVWYCMFGEHTFGKIGSVAFARQSLAISNWTYQ